MGAYLEIGIIVKIESKKPLKEAIKENLFGENCGNLAVDIFEELHNLETGKYEYYPKYFNLEELKETKIRFHEDYSENDSSSQEEKINIEKFFSGIEATCSKELFDEIEKYNKYGMTLDKEGMYIGFKIYKLRLSLDGKIFMECYGRFIEFLEKMIKERYNNGYSDYIKVDLS